MKNNDIKKNMIKLYSIVHNIAKSDYGKAAFSNDLLKLASLPIIEIEKALLDDDNNISVTKKDIRGEIQEIDSAAKAIQYFQERILKLYRANQNEALNSFSTQELKLLFFKIYGVEVSVKKITKNQIVEKVVNRIDSDIRTDDLAKYLQ